MLIGVLSDTHSRYQTVSAAVHLLSSRGVEAVIHCGDITDTPTVQLFEKLPIHFVFGNCDVDRVNLRQAMKDIGAVSHEAWGHLDVDGIHLGWTHGDDQRLFRELENSGHFDFLFYGHSHMAKQHRSGKTLVVNPGALQRARVKTFVILDTETRELESLTVE